MIKCEAGKWFNITKYSQWHLSPFPHALPSFLLSSSTPSTHTSHWSGKLSDKEALERLTRKFLSSLPGNGGLFVTYQSRISESWWLLPPIGLTEGFPKIRSLIGDAGSSPTYQHSNAQWVRPELTACFSLNLSTTVPFKIFVHDLYIWLVIITEWHNNNCTFRTSI